MHVEPTKDGGLVIHAASPMEVFVLKQIAEKKPTITEKDFSGEPHNEHRRPNIIVIDFK